MAGKKMWFNKIRRWWGEHLWFFIGALALGSLALGYIGFRKYFLILGEQRSFLDILYLDLQLFTLESGSVSGAVNWELQIARLLSPAIAAFAALKALALLFREHLRMFKIRFIKKHIIICGLGRKGLLLTLGFIEAGFRVVVIELDEGNDLIPQCREKGALVLIGDATDKDLLRKARVNTAKYIMSMCGDDGVNTEVSVRCKELTDKKKGMALTCIVHIVNPRLCRLLRERKFGMNQDGAFRLEFFNIFDMGARACLSDYPPFDHQGKADNRQSHMLVVGLGRLGENLVIQAAKNWKDLSLKSNQKLNITILDRHAEDKINSLFIEHPPIKKICNLHILQIEIISPAFQTADFLFSTEGSCRFTGVYICLDDDSFGLSTALNLHQKFLHHDIPIVVRMVHNTGLATLLKDKGIEEDSFIKLNAFGLLDRTCTPAIIMAGTHEILAQGIHEEYVRKQRQEGQTVESNPSLVPWPELPESLRESNRSQADHISVKLKHMGCGIKHLTTWDPPQFKFTPEEIERMAVLEHKRWVEERRMNGWTYAPAPKNIKKKTTPYLVTWEELTEDIKELDRNTVRDLPGLLARIGFQIYRLKNKNETRH